MKDKLKSFLYDLACGAVIALPLLIILYVAILAQ